jgi:hypothetical protein
VVKKPKEHLELRWGGRVESFVRSNGFRLDFWEAAGRYLEGTAQLFHGDKMTMTET